MDRFYTAKTLMMFHADFLTHTQAEVNIRMNFALWFRDLVNKLQIMLTYGAPIQ